MIAGDFVCSDLNRTIDLPWLRIVLIHVPSLLATLHTRENLVPGTEATGPFSESVRMVRPCESTSLDRTAS
jgi:hypothetical protein